MSKRLRIVLPLLALCLLGLAATPALAGPAEQAQLAENSQAWAKAADLWQQALKSRPGDRVAAMGLARSATAGNLVDLFVPAEEALQAALEKKSADRDVRLTLGRLFIARALSTGDQTAMKLRFEDAKLQFETLLKAKPNDEEAVVGLAQAHYWTAYFSDALMVLDEFLKGGASNGEAYYWKGQVYYLQAQDAFRSAGEMTDDAKGLFRKALDAYALATKANPERLDAWMQVGYCAQYLGETDAALAAYDKAMEIDQESFMPLKGIEAIYAYEQDKYLPALQDLAKKHPLNRAVYYYLGFAYLFREKWQDAEASFRKYTETSRTPQTAWTYLGKALDAQGKKDEAEAAFRKGLEANPDDTVAAGALEKRIVEKHGDFKGWTIDQAKAALKDYQRLFALAPRNAWLRNNAAFQLREAVGRGGGSGAWAPILDACIEAYTEAAKLVEDLVRGREETLPYASLYQYAGVLNDTGLMFQYYPSRQDLEKAEEYYVRALELTSDGYRDAWDNLTQVYLKQERWQDAYDLCIDCADRLTNEDGSPHAERARAAQIAQQLVRDGKVEGG